MKQKKNESIIFLNPLIKNIGIGLAVAILIILLFVQNCQLSMLAQKSENDRRLYSQLSESLDQTRTFLGMKEYDSNASNTGNNSISTEDDKIFYNAVDFLSKTEDLNKQKSLYAQFITSPAMTEFMTAKGLLRKETGKLKTILYAGKDEFLETSLNDKNQFVVKPAGNQDILFDNPSALAIQKLNELYLKGFSFIDSRKELATQISELSSYPRFKEYSTRHEIAIRKPENTEKYFSCIFEDAQGKQTGEIRIMKNSDLIYVGTSKLSMKKFSNDIVFDAIQNADFRSNIDKIIETKTTYFDELIKNKAFLAAMKEKDYYFSKTQRKDYDYLYYDVNDSKGNHKGAFALSLHTGDFYLVDESDIPIGSLEAIMEMSDSDNETMDVPEIIDTEKTSSILEKINEDSDAILLCGRHEFDTDTMLVLYPNKTTSELIVFGLPRDLYFNHLKINSYYKKFGSKEFLNIVSQITGLKIKHYAFIDMYAFIDVVNLMGGVDITLDRDIIDPTYKVVNNGVQETLYYPKGSYHLNGIETLRIVRSRHFSSDFSRSKRQQKVLSAMKETIVELSKKDMGKVIQILQKLLNYIETDMNPVDVVRLFTNYKDFEMRSQYVIDNSNVLVEAWSNLHFGPDEFQIPEGSGITAKGLYILLPKDDNWDIIHWYVASLINGEEFI